MLPSGAVPNAELVGLIPAAGRARRLGNLPFSKELLPVGWRDGATGPQPRLACDGLLESMRQAGAARAFVVLRDDKLDVARHLGDGASCGVPLAYLCLPDSASLPESLDRVHPFLRGERVALGFPDVQLGPPDALARVAALQLDTGADLALGLFPADRPETTDMVDLDDSGRDPGRVRRVEVRPVATRLRLCWVLAVWGPRFAEHLHDAVAAGSRVDTERGSELQIGAVVAGAVDAGLDVRGVEIPGGWYRDVGTPAGLAAAWREGSLL
jgi:glucose-1-phosphate thymidylyltransferase